MGLKRLERPPEDGCLTEGLPGFPTEEVLLIDVRCAHLLEDQR